MRALAVALCLVSASAALGQTVPKAADKGEGMALMSAIVDTDGTLVNGSGAAASARLLTGRYIVTFHRPITGCALNAVAGSTASNTGIGVAFAVVLYGADPAKVEVLTYSTSASAVNSSFHLMAFCGK